MFKHPLFWLLAVKFLVSLTLVQSEVLGLAPDEAQYWAWSQQLDFGYYSKPPGIAWQIGLGVALFGDTPLGVRFVSIVLGLAITTAIYGLCRSASLSRQQAFWGALAFAVAPMGLLSGVLATTDGGMIFFWTLACLFYVRALSAELLVPYRWIGVMIGCGALFKWPAFVLWIPILLWWPKVSRGRDRGGRVLQGILISLLALAPSIYWNAQNEWATFLHVWGNMTGGPHGSIGAFKPSANPLEFLGAQAVLYSPVFFGLLLVALFDTWRLRKKLPRSELFCASVTGLILGLLFALSLFQRMQGNWAVYAYPTSYVVLMSSLWRWKAQPERYLATGALVSIALIIIVATIPYMQQRSVSVAGFSVPYKLRPFLHHTGWWQLPRVLEDYAYDPKEHFLVGERYQDSSLLSFYAPGQKRAYLLNLRGQRKSQFSYWPGIADEHAGRPAYFVTFRSPSESESYATDLRKYFGEVEYLGSEVLELSYGKVMREALIFKCHGFLGEEPENPEIY